MYPRLARSSPSQSYPGSEKSRMLWLPWTTSTRGWGPGSSGYQTRALMGKLSGGNPQYSFRDLAEPPRLTSFEASTGSVTIATESRYSARFLSVPLP